MTKPKIFVWCVPAGAAWPSGDVLGQALSEDGKMLAMHLSSGPTWSRNDMGVTSDWKHDLYEKHYPDGYELVWLNKDDLQNEAFQTAQKLLSEVTP